MNKMIKVKIIKDYGNVEYKINEYINSEYFKKNCKLIDIKFSTYVITEIHEHNRFLIIYMENEK